MRCREKVFRAVLTDTITPWAPISHLPQANRALDGRESNFPPRRWRRSRICSGVSIAPCPAALKGSTWSARPVSGRSASGAATSTSSRSWTAGWAAASWPDCVAVHLGRWAAALVRDVGLHRRWPLVCNGSYLAPDSLAASPREITPLAGHVAGRFRVAERDGLDVNPVTWHTLARHGLALRGPEPDRLEIRVDSAELHAWTLENLGGYWSRWVERARRPGVRAVRPFPRRYAAYGVLGVSRLHYTLATGEIAGKVQAGDYARRTFGREWHPLIDDALAFWRGGPSVSAYRRHPMRRITAAAEFVARVIEDQAGFTARRV